VRPIRVAARTMGINRRKGGYADEARTLHGDASGARGADLGPEARKPDRAGAGRQGEWTGLAHGRAAFRVEPVADVPGHAVCWRGSPPRPRAMQVGPGLLLLPLLNPVIVAEGDGDARLALRRQRHHRPGGWAIARRSSTRSASPSRSACRAFVEGVEVIRKNVARRYRRASRSLPYAHQGGRPA